MATAENAATVYPAKGRGSNNTRKILLQLAIKRCARCGSLKHLDAMAASGKKTYCHSCWRIKASEYYHTNKQKNSQRPIAEMKECLICHEVKTAEHFHKNRTAPGNTGLVPYCKSCLKVVRLERKYGVRCLDISCEVCERTAKDVQLVADHCHDTEKFRGTLCGPCNSALGLLGNDPERIGQLKEYIEKWQLLLVQ